jgi:hypothetical protein
VSSQEPFCVLTKQTHPHKIISCILFQRILTMLFNTQNYLIFGLCSTSGVLNQRKQNVSENRPVTVIRWRGKMFNLLCLIRRVKPNHGNSFRINYRYIDMWRQALCYKLEGRGFETRWGERFLSIYLILSVALGPGVYSASNRNEYEKQKNNVSGE